MGPPDRRIIQEHRDAFTPPYRPARKGPARKGPARKGPARDGVDRDGAAIAAPRDSVRARHTARELGEHLLGLLASQLLERPDLDLADALPRDLIQPAELLESLRRFAA